MRRAGGANHGGRVLPALMTWSATTRLARLRYAIWGLTVAGVIALAGLYTLQALQENRQTIQTGEAAIHSRFTLTDHTGKRVSEADFAGRWQLVFFGFTYCPDICPTTLAYMARVLDALGPTREKVAPIFITVDPARDTPEIMAEYVSAFHPELVGLTGSEKEIAAAADAFRVYYERVEQDGAPDGYVMAHSGHIYLMTPDGRFESVFLEGDQTADAMARELRRIIGRNGE